MNRLEPLDWQRGLLACSIMLFHLIDHHFGRPDSATLLGRLGIYGVSMFFILSGLSMALVYKDFILDIPTSCQFYLRRIFRIWPLFWLCIFLVSAQRIVNGHPPDWKTIVLDLTTLFGFVSPGSYINTGAWSIGNEMVYYALTPLIFAIYNKHKLIGNIVLIATYFIGIFFSFSVLSPNVILDDQWEKYITPCNNLFMYVTGVALYYNFPSRNLTHGTMIILFITALAIFLFYPATGDLVNIVTGWNRVVFSLASFLMVTVFYTASFRLLPLITRLLTEFGIMTYGIYLLHPITHDMVQYLFKLAILDSHRGAIIFTTMIVTTMTAYFSYRMLEQPLIRLGKKVSLAHLKNAVSSPYNPSINS